ncbi:MAG: chemotaxis protein CheW [Candidatus Schekmanbacteria bacterium]|nr:chemotaxis protein CheW [Candidatus Schekmanbacteria bacterium]
MTQISYLIFRYGGSLYGVKSEFVCEIVNLPAITYIEEVPTCMIGVFNLRGRIVPVIDLAIRFGHTPRRYYITDFVVVIEIRDIMLGIVANDVLQVQDISSADIEGLPQLMSEGKPSPHFLEGGAKVEDEIIMLLDLNNLINHTELPYEISVEELEELQTDHPHFFPEATPDELKLLHKRTQNLLQQMEDTDVSEATAFAIIRLGNEFFAVNLNLVREFTEVKSITPVPCCPSHIAGNINLRGEVLTVVDMKGKMNIPASPSAVITKVMVVENNGLNIGILIDEVSEVISIQSSDITSPPLAVKYMDNEYITGTVELNGRTISLIDFDRIISNGELIVNGNV